MNVLVIGGGKVGTALAALLTDTGHNAKIIETRREKIAQCSRNMPQVAFVLGSGTDPQTLEAAGVRQAQVVVAVTGTDETNITACSLARFAFRVPNTIARLNNPKNAWIFIPDMGVDVALNQANLIAQNMVANIAGLGAARGEAASLPR